MARSPRRPAMFVGYQKVRENVFRKSSPLTDKQAGDGVFATIQRGDINLIDLKSNTTTTLVTMNDIKDVSDAIFAAYTV